MKKYLQLVVVLGIFFIIVLVRHPIGGAQTPAIAVIGNTGSQSSQSPTTSANGGSAAAGPTPGPTDQSTGASATSTPAPTGSVPTPTLTGQSTGGSAGATATPVPTRTLPTPTPTVTPQPSGQYRDGTYTGNVINAYYGYVQVQVLVQNGRITDVTVLQYPHHAGTSVRINSIALPLLKEEAIQAQSAQINGVTGASATSYGFANSLYTALQKAQ